MDFVYYLSHGIFEIAIGCQLIINHIQEIAYQIRYIVAYIT